MKDEKKTFQGVNFIEQIINKDLGNGKNEKKVHTRFPPEPNGYLHIGHAKSICLNFGLAKKYQGLCNLRFDDTNPSKEETEYVESIMEDINWLGFTWDERLFYASDYFEHMYDCAVQLIKKGLAYVCDLSSQEIRDYRGTLKEVGKNSPYRGRSVAENLDLFQKMRQGEFADGSRVLRAKIDMTSPNINMRDPVLYRILRAKHHRTGDVWCIYPMYDYAHPISDAKEGITHSVCTLEFEAHRPLYDWVLEALDYPCRPQQIEFARLNVTRTIMSKRKLRMLVEGKYVKGWDDPRMPTISGIRRRGVRSEAILDFCERIGVSKANSEVDAELLEHCIREDLNQCAERAMAVLRPLKVVIENYPEAKEEMLPAENHPENKEKGSRLLPFSKEIYIEKDDFMEKAVPNYHRLVLDGYVRLKHAYIIKCEKIIKDEATGEIKELRCSYFENSKSGEDKSGIKVKGVIHWVSVKTAKKATVRLYEPLLLDDENTEDEDDFLKRLNQNSLEELKHVVVEPSLANFDKTKRWQFLRVGYFCHDLESEPHNLIFNKVASLKDSWGKKIKKV